MAVWLNGQDLCHCLCRSKGVVMELLLAVTALLVVYLPALSVKANP